ncbi:hypothetical protein DSO57_1035217 [Entomophthora muscae]|uniref:Uncharacterized protein n=1 Tax=Entomophthora muscae TaxID=34485 RepID=A0ACC2TLI3_9FUNG|nr:hypothetical protein DSO57_1035217 [Entomophthora muscae]
MVPPITPKPIPFPAAELSLDHTNKLFGIVYITLTGVIDTIVPTAGPWLWVGKSMSYLIKLAPILWWALPTQSVTHHFPNASKPANQGQIHLHKEGHQTPLKASKSVAKKNVLSSNRAPEPPERSPPLSPLLRKDWLTPFRNSNHQNLKCLHVTSSM